MMNSQTAFRSFAKRTSNNVEDPNKNLCVLAVAKYLGIDLMSTYFHSSIDLIEATEDIYNTSSYIEPFKTRVGDLPKLMQFIKMAEITPLPLLGAIVSTYKHVLLLDRNGEVLVDTAPWPGSATLLEAFLFSKDHRKVYDVTLLFKR